MAKIYEMHKLQVSFLRRLAGTDNGKMGLPGPLPTDPPALIEAFEQDAKLIADLIELGLLEDVSKRHAKQIKRFAKDNDGREHRVFQITMAGRLLFDYCDDPECTTHPLGSPMRRYPC